MKMKMKMTMKNTVTKVETRALSRAGFVTNHGPAGSNTKRISPFPKRSSLITTSSAAPSIARRHYVPATICRGRRAPRRHGSGPPPQPGHLGRPS